MKRLHYRMFGVVLVLGLLGAAHPAEGGCPCETDVNDDNVVNFVDVAIMESCIKGVSCAGCVNSCDVNCDGETDWKDFGAVWCAFNVQSDCCNKPVGACTSTEPNVPACVETYEKACTDDPGLFKGTWHGELTICVGDDPVDIPTVSEWGLAALAILMLIAGSIVMRSRRAVA